MVSLLLVTHAPLGNAFISAISHVFHHRPPYLEALDIHAEIPLEKIYSMTQDAIQRLDTGAGVLVLTDILGSTPSNCASRLIEPGKVEVLAGVNFAMLLRALTYREDGLEVMTNMALAGGKNGVIKVDCVTV